MLTLYADGSFDYLPNEGFGGVDSFSYMASDGELQSGEAVVSLIVNDAPVANEDIYFTDIDTPLNVDSIAGILANDTDAENDLLTADFFISVEHGSLQLSEDGSFTYTPDSGFNGADIFTYFANDGFQNSLLSTVDVVRRKSSAGCW